MEVVWDGGMYECVWGVGVSGVNVYVLGGG